MTQGSETLFGHKYLQKQGESLCDYRRYVQAQERETQDLEKTYRKLHHLYKRLKDEYRRFDEIPTAKLTRGDKNRISTLYAEMKCLYNEMLEVKKLIKESKAELAGHANNLERAERKIHEACYGGQLGVELKAF